MESQKAKELSSAEESIVQIGIQLSEEKTILTDLKKQIAKVKRDGYKRVEDDELQYKQTMTTLEGEIETWRMRALRNQKSLEETRSELQAQIKLMESREAMVRARDHELNTLNTAIDLSDTAALNQAPSKKKSGSFFGIHLTSVVDHRADDYAKPQYYKHKKPLGDYHHNI